MGGGGTGGSSGSSGSSQLKPKWLNDASQLKHIFSDRKGHVIDSPSNRRLFEGVVLDRSNLVGRKLRGGSELFVKSIDDGKQAWVEVRNGLIQDGGINDIPRSFWPGLE
jgi:hypothetical protein